MIKGIQGKKTKKNIQGGGRKFLGHFNRHFGPQISESLKEGHI